MQQDWRFTLSTVARRQQPKLLPSTHNANCAKHNQTIVQTIEQQLPFLSDFLALFAFGCNRNHALLPHAVSMDCFLWTPSTMCQNHCIILHLSDTKVNCLTWQLQCCQITAWNTWSMTSHSWMQTDRGQNMWCTTQVDCIMQVTVAREVLIFSHNKECNDMRN